MLSAPSGPAPRRDRPAHGATGPGLLRGVGRWALVALMINGIVGAGIFRLPSQIDALVGPWGLLAFVACAVVVASIGLCFAEVSSRFSLTGGPYLYAQQAFGPTAGFLMGWLSWLTRVTALAVISGVLADYLAFFWPHAAAGWGRNAAIGGVLAALTIVNLAGVTRASALVSVLTVGKLVPLLLFVGVGMFWLEPARFALGPAPAAATFSSAVFQLVFAFGGFEATVVTAGEARDPRRDTPFALLTAIGVAALFYLSIQVVCRGTLPGLASSSRPLADASALFMGSAGGAIIAVGALVSTTGTLGASLLTAPRLLYAMSEQRQLPGWFGAVHARFRTPHIAILLTAAASLALVLTGTFVYLLTLNVITRLLAYLSTAGALLVFRGRDREEAATFSVPAGPLVALLAIGACLWLLAQSSGRDLRDVGIAVAAGLAVHLADRWRRAARAS